MQGGLVDLAQRLVELDREAAEVRGQMLRLLQSNGKDPDPPPDPLRGRTGPKSDAPHAARATKGESQVLALLKERPMGPSEIMKTTGGRRSTIRERLRGLRKKGLITRTAEGWSATAIS
jgi:hypothetical protein